MLQVRLPSALTLLCLLAACGGKSFETGSEPNPGGSGGSKSTAGSGNAGGSGQGGSSQGGSGQAGQAAAGSSQAGAGGAVSTCESYDDQPASLVQIAIINKTAVPLFLGQQMVNCGLDPLFQVQDASGRLLAPLGMCRSSCDQVRKNGPLGCPAICAFPSSILLPPGGTYYTEYSGLYSTARTLPDACVPRDLGGFNSCDQAIAIQPGEFTFSATAGSSVDCSQTTGMPECGACEPGGASCQIQGSLIAGELHQATTTVVLDAAYGVYPRPLPAPVPVPPDGDAGAVAYLTVELVFTE